MSTDNKYANMYKADQRLDTQKGVEFGTGQNVAETSDSAASPHGMERRDKAGAGRYVTPCVT